jgi:ribosomal protein S25
MNDLIFLNFAEAKKPEYKEKKGAGNGYMEFGEANDYPNYLVSLYDNSAKHNAIVKGKVNYISGNGFKVKEGVDPIAEQFIAQANPSESLDEVAKKVITDIEIFGGSYLQVIWSVDGNNIAEIYHSDYTKWRTNKDNTQFWYSEDWKNNKVEKSVYNAFNTQVRTGCQILYIKEYRPNLNAYSLPGYFGSLNYIESDIEISKHILGNAQTGFSASKMITLPNGEPTDDEKRQIERKFTNRFTGSDGKKFILSFVQSADRKPIIDDLGVSDITKEDFQNVDKLIQQNIYAGHQITAPDLFGIATPGALGQRQQMRDSYEIFKNTYVNDKQRQIEQVFSNLAKLRGATSELVIVQVEPIGIEFSENIITQFAPKEWILEKLGIDSSEFNPDPTIVEPQQMKASFSDDDVINLFANCGEDKEQYQIFQSREVFSNVANESEEAMHMEFAEQSLTQLESNIVDLISKDKRISPETIASTLKVDIGIIEKVLSGLESKGILGGKTGEKRVLKPLRELNAPKPTTTTFQIKYSYEWLSSIPSSQRDSANHPSREFCRRLMKLNKLYSRTEIEAISARLGYSVFDRRGGWWTMPNGEHSPSCRHRWFSQVVIKKG